jgi:hypothetical protein
MIQDIKIERNIKKRKRKKMSLTQLAPQGGELTLANILRHSSYKH